MPSLNFQKYFVSLIESGVKRQTIRPLRKSGKQIEVGDKLYLFTGLRTKYCKRIYFKHEYNGNLVWAETFQICLSVNKIIITDTPPRPVILQQIMINGEFLSGDEVAKLCRADGFENPNDLFKFFKSNYGLPFKGVLIKW